MSDNMTINLGCLQVTIECIAPGKLDHLVLLPKCLFPLPGVPSKSTKGGKLVYQLRDDTGARMTVSGVDKKGNPATVDASKLTVTSSHEEILTVSLDASTGVVTVTPVGPLGTAQANLSFDDGDGTPVTGSLDIEIVSGELASITLSPGETFPLDTPPAP